MVAGRIMSFAGLRYYQLTTDGERAKFLSDCQEKITNYTTPLVFFSLELNRLDEDALKAMYDDNDELARYAPVLRRIRAMKPYQLSDELEKFLHDLGVVGDAWERLFDETIAGLTFTVDGEEMGIEGTLNLLTDQDRDQREAAARELARVFGENIRTFSRVHNTAAKEKEVIDRWRGCPPPDRAAPVQRCGARGGRSAARRGGGGLSQALAPLLRAQAQMAGPRPDAGLGPQRAAADGETRTVDWDDARATVMEAYAAFDPRMADLAEPFF